MSKQKQNPENLQAIKEFHHGGGSNNPPTNDEILRPAKKNLEKTNDSFSANACKEPFLDWLSLTIPYNSNLDFSLFGNPTLARKKGYLNYTEAIDTDLKVLIAKNPANPELGIYFSLSAKSLFLIQKTGKTLRQILNFCIENKGHFTRVDLTIDDFEGLLNLDLLIDKVKKGEINTRLRKYEIISNNTTENKVSLNYNIIESGAIGQTPAKTLYIGNRQDSNAFFRIYDKAKKENHKGHWIRVELVLRHENADQFLNNHIDFQKLVLPTGELKTDKKSAKNLERELIKYENRSIGGLIFYYLKFLEPSYNKTGKLKHKRNWKISPFWIDFLKTDEPQKIGLPKYEKGLEELKLWTLNNISGLDTMLYQIYGQEYIDEKKRIGFDKIAENKRYQGFIREWNLKNENLII